MNLEIFSDLICPWCFIGKRRLDEALATGVGKGVNIIWRAYQLYPGIPEEGMDRADFTRAHIPENLPETFDKKDGMPDVAFEGYKYFTFPMDHHEFIESGVIGNPLRATKEKGEEAFRRLSEHVARGVLELMKVEVNVHNREFVDRVL